MCQKEGWIERNGIVQRGVLAAGGGAHRGDQAAANADLRKGAEGGALAGPVVPDG